MESILDWNTKEGKIFRGGSGSGINLSNIRGSMEPLAKGGTASGPVSFMRGADSWAGTIKSGGKTRRAAKMVVLDVDHPDIREFIWCKAREEEKAEALARAGFDMSIDGDGFQSIQYQNANNSVRVTDAFMHAVENDERLAHDRPHHRRADRRADPRARAHARHRRGRVALRRPGRPVRHDDQPVAHVAELGAHQRVEPVLGVHARRRQRVQPRVAEPHEVPPSGRHVRRRRVRAHRRHRLPRAGDHRRAVELPDRGDRASTRARSASSASATRTSARTSWRTACRTTRTRAAATAAAITALMTGRAYRESAKVAAALGPYERYEENREPHNAVMRMHRDASYAIPRGRDARRPPCSTPRGARGRRPSSSARRTATATPRRRCSRRPGRSRSSWTATRPASSPTSRS